jgi:hypothetical protein
MKLNPRSQQPVRSGVLPPRRKLVSGVFSLAMLFLATGTAHAQNAEQQRCIQTGDEDAAVCRHLWWTDCRHGWITKVLENEDDNSIEVSGARVRIYYDELRKLVKELPFILRKVKACDAYRKCLDDRDAGKVKHCYANDRRWREFYTGAW